MQALAASNAKAREPYRESRGPGRPKPTRAAICNVGHVADALPGRPSPLGATPRDGGTNFAVASSVAEAAEVGLFDEDGKETRVGCRTTTTASGTDSSPGSAPGRATGTRVHGPYDTARGLRCNPAKLLIDPYARAVRGEVAFGPEVFDYEVGNVDAPSSLDSAGTSRSAWSPTRVRLG